MSPIKSYEIQSVNSFNQGKSFFNKMYHGKNGEYTEYKTGFVLTINFLEGGISHQRFNIKKDARNHIQKVIDGFLPY